MKYNKEIKVGLSILLSVIIFVLGVRFFADLPLFHGTYTLQTTFEDASGIMQGNAVRINGVRVGSVDDVRLDPASNKVSVRFHVDEQIVVPEGSRTEVSGIAALNSVHLKVHLGPSANARIPEGGLVPSLREANMLGELTQKAPELVAQLEGLLVNADATFGEARELLDHSDDDIRATLLSFRSAAATLDGLLRAEQARLSRTLVHFESASSDLSHLTAGARAFADANGDSLALAVRQLNQNLRRLDRTLAGLETSTATLDAILVRIDRGEGTLGKLINDPALYAKLDSTLNNLNALLAGFEEDPGRYLKELKLIDIF